MVLDTVDTTDTTTARGLLMLNLLLWLHLKLKLHPKLMPKLPLPTMVDTTAMDFTVADTVDTTDTTTARGLLMLNPKLMLPLMPTMDTTAVDTDTVTDTDTTVKLLLKQQIFKAIFPLL